MKNNNEIRKTVEVGNFAVFAEIPVIKIQQKYLLLDDLVKILENCLRDIKNVTPAGMEQLVPIVIFLSDFSIATVNVINDQGSLFHDAESINESALEEAQFKVDLATEIATNAIDVGNNIANLLRISPLSAEDVNDMFENTPDENISRHVAARARGFKTSIEFNNSSKTVGGLSNVPIEVMSEEKFIIKDCKVSADRGHGELRIHINSPSSELINSGFTKSGEVVVKSDPLSFQGILIRHAHAIGAKFDAEIGVIQKIKDKKNSLILLNVMNSDLLVREINAHFLNLVEEFTLKKH